MEELQNENENLSKTVEELTQRLMLHEEDSDDENMQEEHVFARKIFRPFCQFFLFCEILVRKPPKVSFSEWFYLLKLWNGYTVV